MVNRIDIQVNATGNFSQLNAQIAELKAAVAQLQSKPLLGDTGRATAAQLAQIQTQFDKMLLSTRAFNVETVKMSNSIDNFGNRLQAGKLHFSEYARMYRQTMKGMRNELDALADSQARVAKSVVLPDALRTGYARVITNLTSDLKSLNSAEEAAIIKTKALNSVIHGMGTSLVNMGKNTQWAGRQLTVGLTVPVAAFGAMAAKVFKDVNTELTRMQRMYGTGLSLPSEQEIAKVSTAIIDLSKKVAENMGIAQKETVTAAANFAAVGTTGDALIVATEQAMRLSKLGAVSADTAQKTITSLQTTFRVGTKDVAEAVNFLNDIQKQTSTDLQDLTDAIPRVGPIVSQLGGTYKDTAVMMVAMKEAGVPAAQSANAIKSAVASMIGPTRQARDEFEKYGISLTKIKDDTQGNPIKMIEALQTSLQKLSPLVQAQLIEKLFGKFQFARVTALINNLGAAGSQTQNAFLVAKASVSELARLADSEMKIATESTTAKWSRALEGFKSTLLPLGEKFMKFGTKVLDFFSKVMHFLDRFKPLENLLVNVLGGAAIVGPILMLVGLFGNLAGNIIKGVNYFRMFAQGAKDGGILAGFKSMANFFEMINIETLASSKNMDGLTTSTEKTVEAFAVLNQEIGIMTRSLNEVFARSTRMPIVASPYAQQTLAELQYANPNYNKVAGATEAVERPHMFPASRLWGGWNENAGNVQGRYPMLGAFLGNRALFQSMEQQESWMRKGTSEQWGAPVPSGGAAAELQKKFGKEDVIYGPKFGVSKEDVYTRGFQKLEQIKLDIINGEIKADSKAAAEMEKIAALPIEEQIAALTSIIDRVVFSEEQYFRNLIETLVQSQALLSTPEDMLKAVDMKIKAVMSDPTIADKPAEIQKVIGDFNRDFKLLGGTIVENITAYRLLVEEAILSTNSAFETAIVAAQFRAGIVSGAEMSGGIRSSALGKVASMDKQPLSQALLFARQVPKGFQTGGTIHAQDGVWVPGTGSGDRVPAMLEPGEFVVNRNAAKQYGGLLEHLNWNAAPRFGTGGDTGLESIGIRGYQNAGEVEKPKAKVWVPKDLLGLSKGENFFVRDMFSPGGQFRKVLYGPILNELRHQGYKDDVIERIKKSFNSDRNLRLYEDRSALSEALASVIGRGNRYGIDLRDFSEDSRGRIMATIENERLRTHEVHDFKYFDPNAPVRFSSARGMPSIFKPLRKLSFDEAYGGDVDWVRKLVPDLASKYMLAPWKADDYLLEKHGAHILSTSRAPRIVPTVRQKGGGIPGYQSGLTVPVMSSSNSREQQQALMEEYIQKALRPSSALGLLQEEIFSAVSPSQLELIQKGYGHEVLQYNSNLAKILEQYTFNEKSFVLRPGYTPQRENFNLFNTLGKNERFHMGMSKTQFETWQPTSMFSTSERSPLFTRTLAQAIKEQGKGIGSIGIVPEELSLSPFSEKMYQNLRRRGMGIEVTGNEPDFRPNLYETNDVNLEESRNTTKHILDRLLRRITTDKLYNNSFTYNSQRPLSGEPGSYGISRGFVDQMDVQHRIPELEAKTTMMRFLRQSMFKQKGGGIPGYQQGGGPTWMARGNPYTEAQFQQSLESWIRPVLHGLAPWNNPQKETYRPMGELYKGFYRDIFNDQMRNIGRQDLLRAMVVDNAKGGANMHPWITSMVNAAEDRYYPPGFQGIRVPAMENIQGPWVAQTTRPFTSFTDIKDTSFLKKRFMPSFDDKRFWNAMARGNKLPFFLHAMTGPETMGLPVSKLFAGQTYYGNEGEFVLPQGQKFPMTGYGSDLATRLPVVHSIAPGSTKMIGGMRIPVAQTGGMIPGFQEGYTDYLGSKITGPLGYAVTSGITGTYNIETGAGPQAAYLKQIFEPGMFDYGEAPVNKREMVMEAFLNQLQRGLGGSQAAIDQVYSRLIDPAGEGALRETSVLRSKFLEGFETYKSSGLSTTVGVEDFRGRIDPQQTFKRFMESALIGNEDLHDENFGYVGKTPTVVDSGITAIHKLLKGYGGFDNTISEHVNLGNMHDMRKAAMVAKTLLQEQGINIEEFSKTHIDSLRSKLSEELIHNALLKATGGVPELMTVFDELTQKSYGANFVPSITKVLHKRLDSLARFADPTNPMSGELPRPTTPQLASNIMKNFMTTRLQTGGSAWVPGFGEGDRVPAMLEPGEYVINKKAAKAYGGLLEDINWKQAPRFERGTPRGQGDYISRQREQQRGLSARQLTRAEQGFGGGIVPQQAAIIKTEQTMAALSSTQKAVLNLGGAITTATTPMTNFGNAVSTGATRMTGMTRAMAQGINTWQNSRVTGMPTQAQQMYPAYSKLRSEGIPASQAYAMLRGTGYSPSGTGIIPTPKEGPSGFRTGFSGARQLGTYTNAQGEAVQRYAKMSDMNTFGQKAGFLLGRQARPGMTGMFGGQMAMMATQQATANMQEGTQKSAIQGLGMGAMIGGMTPLGPIGGAVVGAIAAGAYSMYKQHEQKLKNASAFVKDALNVDAVAMEHLGIKARDFSNIMVDSSGKITTATSDFQKQVADYQNTQDEDTKTAIQGLKDKLSGGDISGITAELKTRIGTAISSLPNPQDTKAIKKVMEDNKAFLAAAGVGNTTIQKITKDLDPTKMTAKSILNQSLSLTPFTSRIVTSKQVDPKTGKYVNAQTYDVADQDKFKAFLTQAQTKTDPLQLGKMFTGKNPKPGDSYDKNSSNFAKLKLTMRTDLAAIQGQGSGWNILLAQMNKIDPQLAKIDQGYAQNIKDGTSIIRINNLMSMGLKQLTIAQQKIIDQQPNVIAGLERQYSTQSAVTGGMADFLSNAQQYDAQQNDQADAANKAAEALQNQKDHYNNLINGQNDYINSQNKSIDKIQKEMDARNKLADAQNKEIERQRTLSDLKDAVTSARSSGNLLEMASAQSKYNEELAKQAEAKKKEAEDAADEKRIAGLKSNIDKANKQIEKYNKKLAELDKISNNNAKLQSKNWNTVSGTAHKAEKAVNGITTAITEAGSDGTWTSLKELQDDVLGKKGMKGKLDDAGLSSQQVRDKIKELYESMGGDKVANANKALKSTKDAIDGIGDSAEKALATSIFQQDFLAHPTTDKNKIKAMAATAANAAKVFTAAGKDTSGAPQIAPTPPNGAGQNARADEWYQDPDKTGYYWQLSTGNQWNGNSPATKLTDLGKGSIYHKWAGTGWDTGTTKKAFGGIIHAATGIGPVMGPGGPRDDLIPAMLSNGEYVIQASSVNKYGKTMMDAINGGNFSPRYATGGIMRSYSVGGDINNNSVIPAPQYNVNIVVNGANASADDIADMVATRFRRETESMSSGRSLRA